MGGLGISIGLATAPADIDALHREVWDVLADQLSRYAGSPASEEIAAYYLHFQSSDGFADGNWHADSRELSFSFSDAAGNCVVEMYACAHWISLLVLDRWSDLTEVAARHGATLTPRAEDPEAVLRAALTGRARTVFFLHFTDEDNERLGYAETTDTPADDHELRFYALDSHTMALSETGRDRERLTQLITTGQCACDVCQNLRHFRKLPRARNQFE